MMARRARICLLFAAVLAAPAAGQTKPTTDAPRRVTFTTADGVEIVADYYAPRKRKSKTRVPCAILIHMFPADRTSWKPLVPALRKKGFAVLAYDIRGAGESILPREKHLRRLYHDRDADLFANAWQDAAAAVKWLSKRKECDASRIVLVGASVGCSISLDYAVRNKDAAAVVCLSPGLAYMGLPSIEHIRKLESRPVLLVAPEGERSAVDRLAESASQATVEIHPGGQELHGTRMFDAEYGSALIERIGEFAAEHVRKPTKPKE